MSDFECKNGHLMPLGKFTCPICGAKLFTMDGKTARQIEAEEAEERESDLPFEPTDYKDMED